MRTCQSHFFVISGENKKSLGQRRKSIPDLIWFLSRKAVRKLLGMSDDEGEGDGSGQEDEAEMVVEEEEEEEEVGTGPRISKDLPSLLQDHDRALGIGPP